MASVVKLSPDTTFRGSDVGRDGRGHRRELHGDKFGHPGGDRRFAQAHHPSPEGGEDSASGRVGQFAPVGKQCGSGVGGEIFRVADQDLPGDLRSGRHVAGNAEGAEVPIGEESGLGFRRGNRFFRSGRFRFRF